MQQHSPVNPPLMVPGGLSMPGPAAGVIEPPLPSSAHTHTFPSLLAHLGISLVVSTYQLGKLVLLRADNGALNTHFLPFKKPMGVAATTGRLAIGAGSGICVFHNIPAASRQLDPPNRHDAVYLPHSTHVTGEILIHEMAWAQGAQGSELWFVNTRFSCLCVRSERYNFEPRWRPPFISALAPEDRCHLNGLGMRDGRPRYVTALAQSDIPLGWRENKKTGGILMDIADNRILADGLSMPHSPRWHDGKLWLLVSGDGGLGYLDPQTNQYRPVATLPGFTRGLDFVGPYAFIGLSQVRESAIFSGIAIADRPESERRCGVWVVDVRNGQTVAYLQFDGVEEIFAVQVLPSRFPGLITAEQEVIEESFEVPDGVLAETEESLRQVRVKRSKR